MHGKSKVNVGAVGDAMASAPHCARIVLRCAAHPCAGVTEAPTQTGKLRVRVSPANKPEMAKNVRMSMYAHSCSNTLLRAPLSVTGQNYRKV